jgi:hypothetical protein
MDIRKSATNESGVGCVVCHIAQERRQLGVSQWRAIDAGVGQWRFVIRQQLHRPNAVTPDGGKQVCCAYRGGAEAAPKSFTNTGAVG